MIKNGDVFRYKYNYNLRDMSGSSEIAASRFGNSTFHGTHGIYSSNVSDVSELIVL